MLEGQVLERSTTMGLGRRRPGVRSTVCARLTDREYEVVTAVADGLDNAGIAERLAMGEGTVRNHIGAILAKLELRNRTQLAVAYYRGLESG